MGLKLSRIIIDWIVNIHGGCKPFFEFRDYCKQAKVKWHERLKSELWTFVSLLLPTPTKRQKRHIEDNRKCDNNNWLLFLLLFIIFLWLIATADVRVKRQDDDENSEVNVDELCQDRPADEYFRLSAEGDCRDVVRWAFFKNERIWIFIIISIDFYFSSFHLRNFLRIPYSFILCLLYFDFHTWITNISHIFKNVWHLERVFKSTRSWHTQKNSIRIWGRDESFCNFFFSFIFLKI